MWNSYWWLTPLYATEANLRSLASMRGFYPLHKTCKSLLRILPRNAFDTALLVSCLALTGCTFEAGATSEIVDYLLHMQCSDGSWPVVPILRLSPRECHDAAAVTDSTPVFADQNRYFTSATAVAALSAAWVASRR